MDDLAVKTYTDDVIVHVDGLSVPITAATTIQKPVYQLLYASSTGGEFVTIVGGSYVWAVVADNFNGATVVLQCKGPDGIVVLDIATATANAAYAIYVGEATLIRAQILAGPPTAVYSDLRAYLT